MGELVAVPGTVRRRCVLAAIVAAYQWWGHTDRKQRTACAGIVAAAFECNVEWQGEVLVVRQRDRRIIGRFAEVGEGAERYLAVEADQAGPGVVVGAARAAGGVEGVQLGLELGGGQEVGR